MAHTDEDCRMIGAILPQGIAPDVLRRLREEKGIVRTCIAGARKLDHLLQFAPRATGEEIAVEILNAVVPAGRADELFEFVYVAARIDRPDGGIVFQHVLAGATHFDLPDIPEEN